MKLRVFLLAACVALSGPLRAADALPDLGESSQADISPAAERRFGEQVMRDIRLRDPGYVDDPEVEAYINLIGGRLAAASREVRQDFDFFAMRDATLNAFALPGGFIGVHTGLILAAQSESELAGVLAHEIAHVTQRHIVRLIGKQSQASLVTLAAMVVAILAARSNSQMSQAAVAAGAAANIQTQLNYTRDFEREADRIGLGILEAAGFDRRGMVSFFERLQKFGRLYENNAPAYLRTHPLTVERIADIENRVQAQAGPVVPDSDDFQFVRAKLRAQLGTPAEAVDALKALLAEGKEAAPALRYGLAHALFRARDYEAAEAALAQARRQKPGESMADTLAAEIRLARGDRAGAIALLRDAHRRHPQVRAVTYALVDALLADAAVAPALELAGAELRLRPGDARLWLLQAKAYAAAGKRLMQHRSQAEAYLLQGQLAAAVEQLQIAQKAGDGDFYEASAVDARLRELRRRHEEETRPPR